MKNNDWKDRLNVVYSTNPDFGYEMDNDEEQVTLDKDKQNLRVSIDKKNRGGKVVTHTIITTSINANHNHRELYFSCILCINPVLCNIAPNMKEGAKCNIKKGLYSQWFL